MRNIQHCLLIIFSYCILIINSNDYTEHLIWRTGVDEFRKDWMSYIEKWLDKVTNKITFYTREIISWFSYAHLKTNTMTSQILVRL